MRSTKNKVEAEYCMQCWSCNNMHICGQCWVALLLKVPPYITWLQQLKSNLCYSVTYWEK